MLALNHTQDLVYIGAMLCTDLGRLYLQATCIQTLISCIKSFSKVGEYNAAHHLLSLLWLMAVTLQLVKYAHLHMHPIQWYLKWRCNLVHHLIFVSKDLKCHLHTNLFELRDVCLTLLHLEH